MKQKWNIGDIQKKIDAFSVSHEEQVVNAIFGECVAFAVRAHNGHTYRNYKGELESSVGVVVLKDLQEVKEWKLIAASGTDPSRGITDFSNVLQEYIIGQSTLPDGTQLPEKGIAGIVFAAAPYAGIVEGGMEVDQSTWTTEWQGVAGKKVLHDFAPPANEILQILKVAIGKAK